MERAGGRKYKKKALEGRRETKDKVEERDDRDEL